LKLRIAVVAGAGDGSSPRLIRRRWRHAAIPPGWQLLLWGIHPITVIPGIFYFEGDEQTHPPHFSQSLKRPHSPEAVALRCRVLVELADENSNKPNRPAGNPHHPLERVRIERPSMISLIITLVVIGVLLSLVNTYIPMDGKIKQILNAVVVICVVVWLLSVFGVLGHAGDIQVPQVR
jgi:hypothetical protein